MVQYSPSLSFIRWGELNEESLEEDISHWLYKDEDETNQFSFKWINMEKVFQYYKDMVTMIPYIWGNYIKGS